MEKRFVKGSEEWQFFADYYKFRQQYYEADNPDEWFQELMSVGEQLIEKYKDTEISDYVRKMVLTHFEDVEIRYKKSRK